MGRISIDREALGRLLPDGQGAGASSYQQAFNDLAGTHRGRPVGEILPALRRAADRALLGFTPADLREQAVAISSGEPYELRVTLT
ncbi:hypothetical protein AB0952_09455 [Streptomyces caniferus]|uniref:hypothetical protein n=1 Tax=Streptomyces TaxID=1883 RepID=UPI0033D6C948